MKHVIFILIILFPNCQTPIKKDTPATEIRSYHIGSKHFIWSDADRIDPYYGGSRLINVQVWYPIDSINATSDYPPAPYYYTIDEAAKSLENWSEEDLKIVSSIPMNSLLNPPISGSPKKYPLLIYSPSLGGNLSLYTYYAENLAKAGFIVVGVNHLYESEYVLTEDRAVITSNLIFHDSLKNLNIPEQISAEKYREVKGERQKILGEDLVFCLDKILEINETELDSKIDVEKIGVFGHSIGGAAAIYASILDRRFKAVVDIDGTPPTIALKQGIDVPFMFIEDLTDYENHIGYGKMHRRRSDFCQLTSKDAYRILIAGINHNSFLDINYYDAQNESEKAKALELLQKTTYYMTTFFEAYLYNKKIALNELKSDSLEILKFVKE